MEKRWSNMRGIDGYACEQFGPSGLSFKTLWDRWPSIDREGVSATGRPRWRHRHSEEPNVMWSMWTRAISRSHTVSPSIELLTLFFPSLLRLLVGWMEDYSANSPGSSCTCCLSSEGRPYCQISPLLIIFFILHKGGHPLACLCVFFSGKQTQFSVESAQSCNADNMVAIRDGRYIGVCDISSTNSRR